MASQNVYSVTLDEAIEAMRLTAVDMSVKYKETSLSVSREHPFFFGYRAFKYGFVIITGSCGKSYYIEMSGILVLMMGL